MQTGFNRPSKWVAVLGVWLLSSLGGKAQFLEISAEIDLIRYRSGDTNAEVTAQPRKISVVCITGTGNWRIENDWSQNAAHKWFFDGTNV